MSDIDTALSGICPCMAETCVMARDAVHRLAARVSELQFLCGAAYQAVGAADGPVEMLDNLSDAANGDPLRHDPAAGLPWVPAALAKREAVAVPAESLVCVGRARFPKRGGNAGISWYVEDALDKTDGFRSGSPANGELIFVLPATVKRAMLAASQQAQQKKEEVR